MSIFVEKWPLLSRSIISGNTKDTEKLIRKKIFVILFRIIFSVSKADCDIWIHLSSEEILGMYIYNSIVEYLPKLCKAVIRSKGYYFNKTKVWLSNLNLLS